MFGEPVSNWIKILYVNSFLFLRKISSHCKMSLRELEGETGIKGRRPVIIKFYNLKFFKGKGDSFVTNYL